MKPLPHKCPSCSEPVQVSQLSCSACETVVIGNYELSPICRLSAKSLKFLETFILNRGNVKEMERNTGESYWAIRRRLDEVIAEMDLEATSSDGNQHNERQDILNRLKSGEIDVHEAAASLRKLGE